MDLDTALTGKAFDSSSATDLLRADHGEMRRLMNQYDDAKQESVHARRVLVEALCLQLELHARVEHEVFYPAMHRFEGALVATARQEHEALASMAASLEHLSAEDSAYEAAAERFIAAAKRHIDNEEQHLFPAAEAGMAGELQALGAAIIDLKKKLTGATEEVQGRA